MAFVGGHSAKLDDKGRLIFPMAFRLQATGDEKTQIRFVGRLNVMVNCIDILPVDEWKIEYEELKSKLDMYDADDYELWQEYLRDLADIVPDEKTGRILIPKKMLESVGIDKEAFFAGAANCIQLWDKATYENNKMDRKTYAEKLRAKMQAKK